jgi:A/G-specific adenine glycosylase
MVRRNGVFPATRSELEQLPNVGQYIANAVLLFCYRKRQPLLDVNMSRVLERFFGPRKLADIRYDPYLQALAKEVVSGTDPMRLNWAILDHASMVCKVSNPLCEICPFTERCKSANNFQRKVLAKTAHDHSRLPLEFKA